jgi:hypothetical protein
VGRCGGLAAAKRPVTPDPSTLPPWGDWYWDGTRWVLIDEDALADE